MKREHYGKLSRWWKIYPDTKLFPPQGLGYLLGGTPPAGGHAIRTSWVLRHNEKTGNVMTLHGRYALGAPREASPYEAERNTP